MSYQDDIYNQIVRNSRARTGRSFFPAANTSAGGQTLNVPDSTYGFRALPPDQNPAYQAAIARPRPNMNNYAWITTPSGGQMRVPTGSVGNLLAPGTSLTGSTVTQIGNQLPIDRAAAYAKGYGAPTPTIQPSVSGPVLAQGGVANPVENLTPQARIAGGVGSTLDYLRSNPALNLATNALGGFGRNIASWFGGGNMPSMPPAAAAGSADYIPRPAGAGNLVPPPALPIPPAPAGINNLVPPNPYVGRQPNEQMLPTGAGGSTFFPSANPASGTVTMGNEKFPGNMPVPNGNPYPTTISNPIYNPSLPAAQYGARRYSDYGYY